MFFPLKHLKLSPDLFLFCLRRKKKSVDASVSLQEGVLHIAAPATLSHLVQPWEEQTWAAKICWAL